MPEDEFSRLLLALFIGAAFAGMVRLAARKTYAERFMKSFAHRTDVSAAVGARSLSQTLDICTPVFLGFSLTYLFPEIVETDWQVLAMLAIIFYIIWWLWMQRSLFSYIELVCLSKDRSDFSLRKKIIFLESQLLGLTVMYSCWVPFVLTEPSRYAVTGTILAVDFLYHIGLAALVCQQRRARSGDG